jgi:hypothetical protein
MIVILLSDSAYSPRMNLKFASNNSHEGRVFLTAPGSPKALKFFFQVTLAMNEDANMIKLKR